MANTPFGLPQQTDPYSGSRNMASALGNFKAQQGALQAGQTQVAPMGAPQQQAPSQPWQAQPHPISGRIRNDEAYQAFQHRQSVFQTAADQADAQKKQALAEQVRAANANAAAMAEAASTKDSMGTKRDMMLGIMKNAKHPLDALALGILGWKMRKEDKALKTAQITAAQEAQKQAQATLVYSEAEKERASKQSIVDGGKIPDQSKQADIQAAMNAKAAGRTSSSDTTRQEQRGFLYLAQDEKVAEKQGGGAGALTDTTSGESANDKQILNLEIQHSAVRDIMDDFSQAQKDGINYLSAESDVKGAVGGLAEYLTGKDMTGWSEESKRKYEWQGKVMGMFNRLIKERSGAAVTPSEMQRLQKELFGKFTGATEFWAHAQAFSDAMVREKAIRMRAGNIAYDPETGEYVEKIGAPPLITDDVNPYKVGVTSEDFNVGRPAQTAAKAAVEAAPAATQAVTDATGTHDQAAYTRYQQAIDYQKSLGEKGNVQAVIDLANQQGLDIGLFK